MPLRSARSHHLASSSRWCQLSQAYKYNKFPSTPFFSPLHHALRYTYIYDSDATDGQTLDQWSLMEEEEEPVLEGFQGGRPAWFPHDQETVGGKPKCSEESYYFWCLPPVWNLGAASLIPLYLVLLPNPAAISVLNPFLLLAHSLDLFFPKPPFSER